MAIMTERIKNHQAKNHFAHDQKHAKKIKRSIENNLNKNGCTATNNDTFQMFGIPANKISKDLLQKLSSLGVSVKKVLLKISRNSQEDTCKIDLKMNLKMNLNIDPSTVVFSCESCEIFKSTYFVEHQRTAASATDPRSIGQHIYQQH